MGEIIITVSPDGSKSTVEVQGVKGKSCEDVTKQLVKAFGEIDTSKRLPEYYMESVDAVHTKA